MITTVHWTENGAPARCAAHYFAAVIGERCYHVTKSRGSAMWRAWLVRPSGALIGCIGHGYAGRQQAMDACSRDAGIGNASHTYARSRASLVVQANEVIREHVGKDLDCTFAACTDAEILGVIKGVREIIDATAPSS